jgi:hypothetical protein
MKYRIAFSVTCGILCLLFVALWVRSYWRYDLVYYRPATSTLHALIANNGVVIYANVSDHINSLSISPPISWARTSFSAAEIRALTATHTSEDPLVGVSWSRAFPGFAGSGDWLHVPIWFLVLLSAGLATAPWLPRRYSLRTLLVAMTLVAVGLGAIDWGVAN